MLEPTDFQIKDKQQGTPINLKQTWWQWLICLLSPKPKPATMKMDDIRIQDNQYSDTEIKVKPWGRKPE